MADNVNLKDGTGAAVVAATDQLADSSHAPKVQLLNGKQDGGFAIKAEDAAFSDGDPGLMVLAVRKAAPADTSGNDGDYEPLQVKDGALWMRSFGPGTGTLTSVAGSASSTSVLAANTARRGATIFNDSTAILRLRLEAAAASSSNFSVKLQPDDLYEVPFGYTGEIRGIWDSATGNARVTEFT